MQAFSEPRPAPASPIAEPMTVALVGFGEVGVVHHHAYRNSPAVRLVGVADPNPARLALIDPADGVPTYARLEDMLAEQKPQIACVLTPAATHEDVVRACAQAGAHVLCEKPLALSEASAEAMIAACREAGVKLSYGSSYRHLPAVREARRLIAEDAIGRVRLLQEQAVGGAGPKAQRPMGPVHYPVGGPGGTGMGLVDHGVHLIDIFGWLIGDHVRGVFGRGNRTGEPLGVEFLTLTFDGGAVGQLVYDDGVFPTTLPGEGLFSWGGFWDAAGYHAGGQWAAHPGCIHVHGERGALRIFHYANALFLNDADGLRQIPVEDRPAPHHFAAQIEAFVEDIRADAAPATPAEAGVEALRVLLAAYESDGRRTVAIPG
ncbi:MAG: Gfo/Idh/MocA family oxidoreductase [Caulobacteraceae bacterium]|nr:Gfo/Idh/MocA family oxidoreductase [Caulobacteraceae bacterium]